MTEAMPLSETLSPAQAAILAAPWAITPERLETIVSIANRRGDREALQLRAGEKLQQGRTVSRRGQVAVVPVTGPIFRYANMLTDISGATSLQVLASDFTSAVEDDEVDSIILEIDSPGGQVSGINEFAKTVYGQRGTKPVVAYVESLAASAAYWIASAANRIVLDDTALVGSIGVVSVVRLPKDDPHRIEFVNSASDRKRLDPSTEEGRASVQRQVDGLAEIFIAAVANYRSVSPEKVKEDFGRGDVLMGIDAVSAGMADTVDTLEGLIAELNSGGERNQNRSAGRMTTPVAPTLAQKLESTWAQKPELRAEFLNDFSLYSAYMNGRRA